MNSRPIAVGRRRVLAGASGAFLLALLPKATAKADAARLRDAIAHVVGDQNAIWPGRVTLKAPLIADDGTAVPIQVLVESPMSETDYVVSVHIFAGGNPRPHVGTFHLSPLLGRADIQTRIRLAETQSLLAVAQMTDGSFWSGTADVTVTAGGGCGSA